ncbi:hypothetical protein PACILC2_55720 [Paenibacillus cisolokensis]|uniref:ABC transporter substrate-binding protein n=1 Tax=Paenibacillus cisolokensis TaxID=1658519 RepID=A0ABQ4NFH6_9BACL|nr:hypothetical protein PACILC2_55720 [Paenibacillus cisolokensis]
MKKMKALIMPLVFLSVLIGLPACSGGGTKTTPAGSAENPDQGEKIAISFAWWGDAKRHEKYNAIADMYEKEHPNVKIERQYGSFNDYWDKLATQTAGGNAPDVIGMHATYVADYAQRGALLELDPYLENKTIDLSDFPEAVREVGKVDGKTVMVAQGVTMTGWAYNAGTLDKLGVQAPEFDWTWDDFHAKAAEIQKAIGASDDPDRWAVVDAGGDISGAAGVRAAARQRTVRCRRQAGRDERGCGRLVRHMGPAPQRQDGSGCGNERAICQRLARSKSVRQRKSDSGHIPVQSDSAIPALCGRRRSGAAQTG